MIEIDIIDVIKMANDFIEISLIVSDCNTNPFETK